MGRFGCSCGPFWTSTWAVLDLAMGRFCLLRGPFWFMGRFGIDPATTLHFSLYWWHLWKPYGTVGFCTYSSCLAKLKNPPYHTVDITDWNKLSASHLACNCQDYCTSGDDCGYVKFHTIQKTVNHATCFSCLGCAMLLPGLSISPLTTSY